MRLGFASSFLSAQLVFAVGDDFTVCGTWTVTALEFFVYQTNGVPPLITGAMPRFGTATRVSRARQ